MTEEPRATPLDALESALACLRHTHDRLTLDKPAAGAPEFDTLRLTINAEVRAIKAALASISEPARAEEGKEPVAWVDSFELERMKDYVSISATRRSEWDIPLYRAPSSTLEITEEAVEAGAKAIHKAKGENLGEGYVCETWPNDISLARAALEASLPFLSQTGGWRDETRRIHELAASARDRRSTATDRPEDLQQIVELTARLLRKPATEPCVGRPSNEAGE